MDAIRGIVGQYCQKVSQQIESGEPMPNPELADLLRNVSSEIGGYVPQVPAQVSRTLRRNFAALGWDVRTNRSIQRMPPTLEQVHEMLLGCANFLQVWATSVQPTEAELNDISQAGSRLWDLDVNRLIPGVDYQINLQTGKTPYQEGDNASEPLFTFLHGEVFEKPTFRAFRATLDNYERCVGTTEVITNQELMENSTFLDEIMSTAVMVYCHRYLVAKGVVSPDPNEFKAQLNQLWFEMYGRGGTTDSSGFEHVFVGESKKTQVSGLHNWIRIWEEEVSGRLNYRGYIKPRARGCKVTQPHEREQLITIQFDWFGELKPVGSSFIGVSPEFEIALYTLCFLGGEEKNIVGAGPYRAEIRCYPFERDGKTYIGTAFPCDAPLNPNQAATKIQARARGMHVRNVGPQQYSEQRRHNQAQHCAATKIQSQQRGRQARKRRRRRRKKKSAEL